MTELIHREAQLRLFFLFAIVPIIEIILFIEVGGLIGLWPTIGIVIATAAIGAISVRSQGMEVMATLQRDMHAGRPPTQAMGEAAFLLVSGMMLITPGFFTDTIGLVLLLPPVRRALARRIASRIEVQEMPQRRTGAAGDVVDGVYEDITQEPAGNDNAAPTKPSRSGITLPPKD